MELLNVLTTEQEEKPGGNKEAFVVIEQQYEQTLYEVGKNASTAGHNSESGSYKSLSFG
jgi:hypothetical protein